MKQQTAVQFMAVKAKANNDFSREEVLARYKSNIKDYEYPSKVRWQRIRITFSKHGGKKNRSVCWMKSFINFRLVMILGLWRKIFRWTAV